MSRILGGRIKSVPQVLLRLLGMCNDPNADFDQLAGLVEKDTALSARLLRLAATPAYRQWNQIKDLRRLMAVIGTRSLRTMIVTTGIAQLFRQLAPDEHRLLLRIWRQSLATAYSARELARLTGYPAPEEAYAAGLMHRLGQLALLDSFTDEYTDLLDRLPRSSDQGPVERERFGADHAVLGGWLLDRWELDSLLADAVRFQFEPIESVDSAHPLVRLIYLAARLGEVDPAAPELPGECADRLFGLAEPTLARVLQDALGQVESDVRLIGVDDAAEPSAVAADNVANALAAEVNRTALLGALRCELGEVPDRDELLLVARRQLDLLFEIRQAVFFLPEGDHFVGRPQPDQDPALAQLAVARGGNGLLARALDGEQLLDSADFGGALAVVDRQLIERMGGDGLLAVALRSGSKTLGVLALGVPAVQRPNVTAQHDLLRLYTVQLSEALEVLARGRDERELARLEDRAQYEQQARRIVHEANNPLGIISNYLHVLGARLEADHPSAEHLGVIREEIERVGKILLRLPSSYDRGRGLGERLNLARELPQLAGVFEASLYRAREIHLSLDVPETLPELDLDRDRFKQVMINLLKNAGEAAGPGGQVRVTARDGINAGGRNYVEINVIDDGPGVAPERFEHLFRPQGSDKGAGHAGLGLTIAANLVRELGGLISYRAQNPGACFQLLLPCAAEPVTGGGS